MDIVLLVIGALIVGLLVFVVLKLINPPKNDDIARQLIDQFQRDKEDRYREVESLKKEIRDQREASEKTLDRFNRSVDSRLGESAKQLNDRLDKSSHVIGNLKSELAKMGQIGSKIENLDKILRAPKGRGSMGEESLEEILRSVFPSNLWERQYSLGTGMVVDAVVKTSSGIIPIDAKFPLPAFEALMNSEDEESRLVAQKTFQQDVKKRIQEVAKYIREEAGTLNFAILYVPSENIYYEAAIRDTVIPVYANEKRVLLCGPNNMLYVLKLLFQAYQSQEFAKEAQKALSELAGVQKQAGVLEEEIGLMAKHLGNATNKLGDVQKANTNLQGQINNIHQIDGGESQTLL